MLAVGCGVERRWGGGEAGGFCVIRCPTYVRTACTGMWCTTALNLPKSAVRDDAGYHAWPPLVFYVPGAI